MTSLETRLSSLEKILHELENRVRQVLSLYTQKKDWILISRTKDIQSISDKIATGRYRSLSDFDDLVAFSIITDLRSDHREAVSFIKRKFIVESIRGKSTLYDERIFDFDSIRIYAKLPISIPNSPLGEVIFEIQIRTLLQHAWSKVTHPLVYKPRNIDPRKIRLASEVLANLEALDRTLSTFSTLSRSVKIVNRERSAQLNAIVSMVDRLIGDNVIPSIARPVNGRRFAESVLSAMDLRKHKFKDMLLVVNNFYVAQQPHFPLSVSLYQIATVALYKAGMLNRGSSSKPRYNYVTQELISLFPESKDIKPVFEP